MRPKQIQRRPIRHRRRNRDHLVIRIASFVSSPQKPPSKSSAPPTSSHQSPGRTAPAHETSSASPSPAETLCPFCVIACSTTGRFCCLQKLERLNQHRQIVPIHRAIVVQPKLLKDHARAPQSLRRFFRLARNMPPPSCRQTAPPASAARSCKFTYVGFVTILWKYSAIAPTFLSIDHSLSFSTMIIRFV